MLNLLKNIVNGISTIFTFVIHSFQTLLNLFAAIPRFITYITTLIDYVIPDILKPFIILAIIVSVVLFIVNRKK